MFERKPVKKNISSVKANAAPKNAMPKYQNIYFFAACGFAVVALVFLVLFMTQKSKTNAIYQKAKSMSVKIKELEDPKYDLVNDFITDQCGKDGVYCMDVVTKNPGIEILKFLVNFRENPELKYSLFFQVDADSNAANAGYKLDCEPRDSEFYICQQITTSRPTDVIRAFQRSYSSFTPNVNYSFTLMVKPVGQLEMPSQVTVTPPSLKQGTEVETAQNQNIQEETVIQPQQNNSVAEASSESEKVVDSTTVQDKKTANPLVSEPK